MTSWSVEVRGDEAAERRLRQLGVLLHDLRPFWPKVVPLFVAWMGEQFGSEGGWGGAPWAPLTPAYALRKRGGRGILYLTGAMRRAASSPRRAPTPTSLTLTIVDPKAGWHQEGTSKMVARPIIPSSLPMSARIQVDRAAKEYVDDMVARLGL